MNISGTPTPLRKLSGIFPLDRNIVSMLMLEGAKCRVVSSPFAELKLILDKKVFPNTDSERFVLIRDFYVNNKPSNCEEF